MSVYSGIFVYFWRSVEGKPGAKTERRQLDNIDADRRHRRLPHRRDSPLRPWPSPYHLLEVLHHHQHRNMLQKTSFQSRI